MSLNEIVFVGKNGKLLDVSFMEGGVRPNGSTSGNVYAENELKSIDKNDPAYSEYPAYNIIDEQDKFPTELITYKPAEE